MVLFVAIMAKADDKVLQILLSDGQVVSINLNEEPRTTYQDGNLVITSTKNTVTYLVGGKGTKYNDSNVDYQYAHIDEGESNPGYFTDIEDKTTKISNLKPTKQNKEKIYSIQGQALSKPQKGINIINNKKVLIYSR